MEKGFKFRLKPNKEQEIFLNKMFGCTRFIYNYFLALKKEHYNTYKQQLSYKECSSMLPNLKEQYPWLKEADAVAVQQTLKKLETSYKNFFKGSGFPKFKSKHNYFQSYKTTYSHNNIEIKGNHIKLPKVGLVKFINHREIQGKIVNATISKTNTGKYFVSICCNVNTEPMPKLTKSVGIDVGVKCFATLSSGEEVPNPKFLTKYLNRIKELQRQLSYKTKGSINYHKIRIKLAKLHEKVANCRFDFLQKLSTKLICENQTISVEGLNIKSMIQGNDLSQSISDVSWSKFFTMIEYKAKWYGRTFKKVDTYFPSSQLCSVCGAINKEVKSLSVRDWTCSKCETTHQRDFNASVNINNEGLRLSLT
ncbi:IS200/IS605 family element RNA-guided endonuclease TnpB [Clostridium magnum]|uniref:Putative transposase n=1 Tax=Clostridium magnum DSM 2767 TaxID=1121326 RepID=A0A162TJB3_9CLOT|nr:IS200/IS605 family element RNA-guided endonuclease TnpB [Clostridium magnum]KZL92717.1 putative transposase [Clostridium magnum DSM 2767]SHI24728.1 putative transposase [Clostridium magnum DSM 2767]